MMVDCPLSRHLYLPCPFEVVVGVADRPPGYVDGVVSRCLSESPKAFSTYSRKLEHRQPAQANRLQQFV